MAYTPQTWVDNDATRPLSAARLTVMETGIEDADTRATALESAVRGDPRPADHGFTAWSYDPVIPANSSVLTNGTVYLIKMKIDVAVTVANIYWHLAALAVTPTAAQNTIGLYSSAGTLLASTDVTAILTGTTGLKTTAITGQALTAGTFVWVGMVFNAATAPALARGSGLANVGQVYNAGLSAANYRFAVNGTSQTALPASITPGSNAVAIIPIWAAVGP
jgi:hypothetical protein